MLIIEVLVISLGTAICKKTSLGIDPFNALCVGISQIININLGTTVLILNSLLIIIILLVDRSYIGFGTVFTMVSIGYFIDFFDFVIPNPNFNTFSIQNIILFVIGMLIMCFGVSLYFESSLGMVPYDCFAFIISSKLSGKTFIYRVCIDSSASLIAFFIGGPISVGTLILA